MEKKNKKEKKPVDRRKIIQNIVILILVGAMVLSVAASLIYALLVQ